VEGFNSGVKGLMDVTVDWTFIIKATCLLFWIELLLHTRKNDVYYMKTCSINVKTVEQGAVTSTFNFQKFYNMKRNESN
jgi:hypothetical protein